MRGNLPSNRFQKRLNAICMLSHINDSPMGVLRCFRYPKEIQFANIKEDVSRDAILFKR